MTDQDIAGLIRELQELIAAIREPANINLTLEQIALLNGETMDTCMERAATALSRMSGGEQTPITDTLMKALEPFTKLGGPDDGVMPAFHDLEDDVVIFENSGAFITAADIRVARNAFGILHAPYKIQSSDGSIIKGVLGETATDKRSSADVSASSGDSVVAGVLPGPSEAISARREAVARDLRFLISDAYCAARDCTCTREQIDAAEGECWTFADRSIARHSKTVNAILALLPEPPQ